MIAQTATTRSRRAFAMPVALVVVLLVGVVTGLMFERQASQRRLIERQLWWYQEHHARFGIQEVVDAWMAQVPSNLQLEEALGEDGHAADLILSDGTVAVLTLHEGQGSLLTDHAALTASEHDACERMLEQLALIEGGRTEGRYRRSVGPASVSVNSAPPDVIRAVARATLGETRGEILAREILQERETKGAFQSPGALGQVLIRFSMSDTESMELQRMFTSRPTLYYLVVELRRGTDSRPLARYGGYIPLPDRRRTGQADDQAWGRRTAFLSWDDLGVE
ncbi:MAG: hypothetical protein KIS87_07610 [Phycisphaeraceae bacterium]|nr:hypothetical protein [Phycisphaeraceae bacterium]